MASAIAVYEEANLKRLFSPDQHHPGHWMFRGADVEGLRRLELRHCIYAVVMYQAMMEKIPYFMPTMGKNFKATASLEFKGSWMAMLAQIPNEADKQSAIGAFERYHADIYVAMRNPIVHGRKQVDIDSVNRIRMPAVHAGMRSGWAAYDALLTAAFAPDQVHQPSWSVMCESHCVPVELEPQDYPDLMELSAQYNRRHLDWCNNLGGAGAA